MCLPSDLERVLRDQSILVPQDGAVFASMLTPEMEAQIAEWAKAPSDTPSALSSEDAERPTGDKQ